MISALIELFFQGREIIEKTPIQLMMVAVPMGMIALAFLSALTVKVMDDYIFRR